MLWPIASMAIFNLERWSMSDYYNYIATSSTITIWKYYMSSGTHWHILSIAAGSFYCWNWNKIKYQLGNNMINLQNDVYWSRNKPEASSDSNNLRHRGDMNHFINDALEPLTSAWGGVWAIARETTMREASWARGYAPFDRAIGVKHSMKLHIH